MDTTKPTLSPNALAFIALTNEYCVTLEGAATAGRADFVASMTRLLPRLYMSAADLDTTAAIDDSVYISPSLDEDTYESVRRSVETLLGSADTYLEVFESDMKYSDTPIAATVSENLADIFQSCYNFVEMVKDAPVDLIPELLAAMKEDFETYWSAILCNVMRPLNQLRYSPDAAADDDEI